MKYVRTVLVRGHGVASGASATDRRFPDGTIRMQLRFFAERGLDVVEYFNANFVAGTLNLSLKPHVYEIGQPEYFLPGIRWTELLPPENFFLSPAQVLYRDRSHRALLYMPDPRTKPDHFQDPDVVEVLAEPVSGVADGSVIELGYNPAAMIVRSR